MFRLFRLSRVSYVLAAWAVCLAPPLFAESLVRVPDGFLARDRFTFDPFAPFARQLGGLCYSAEGEAVVYEDGQIRAHGEDGARLLAEFAEPVFGDFLVAGPDGESVYFGESSVGNVYRIALDGSGMEVADNIAQNFDLAFAPALTSGEIAGRGFVSGKLSFGDPTNTVWLLDDDPAAANDAVITGIPGFSGPLVFDPDGNLYYGTSGADFSSEGESGQRLVRFTPEQLASGVGDGAVEFAAGEVLLSEIESFYALEWYQGRIYLTNLGLVSCQGAVEVIDTTENFQHSVFATFPVADCNANPTHLAVRSGSADFAAGSGVSGGSLLVAYSDFSTVSNVVEITAQLYFVRGRINEDESVDISDAIALVWWLYLGLDDAPAPLEAADVNDDGDLDLSDAVYLLDFLYKGGPAIPPPYPDLGPDPGGAF